MEQEITPVMSDEITSCNCCNSEDIVSILRAPDFEMASIRIFHCKNCAALCPDYPEIVEDEISRQTSFHEDFWRDETPETLSELVAGMEAVVDFYKEIIKAPGDGTIAYDVGAGRGNLLTALLTKGYDAYGCEPSAELSQQARAVFDLSGDRLVTTSALDFLSRRSDEKGNVDIVFLWHVIEHFENPMEILREVVSTLAPDGVLICQGPMLSPGYVYPAHRFFHSESNIDWIARELGLKVIFMDGFTKERFVSFALAKEEHPSPAIDTVFLTSPEDAVGSLYYTLSKALAEN
ncbi:class I SAM-dependent methyltransferase [Ruegeria atlantica]|uniref:class I SAM-dependent methyltransferase n=1 Tax=Ruegeria atlantica TaxID=81569 RepID=UPI002494E67C|nr:class I SAM-dependent methyltransferase [Ruegeria atlantica]